MNQIKTYFILCQIEDALMKSFWKFQMFELREKTCSQTPFPLIYGVSCWIFVELKGISIAAYWYFIKVLHYVV